MTLNPGKAPFRGVSRSLGHGQAGAAGSPFRAVACACAGASPALPVGPTRTPRALPRCLAGLSALGDPHATTWVSLCDFFDWKSSVCLGPRAKEAGGEASQRAPDVLG